MTFQDLRNLKIKKDKIIDVLGYDKNSERVREIDSKIQKYSRFFQVKLELLRDEMMRFLLNEEILYRMYLFGNILKFETQDGDFHFCVLENGNVSVEFLLDIKYSPFGRSVPDEFSPRQLMKQYPELENKLWKMVERRTVVSEVQEIKF